MSDKKIKVDDLVKRLKSESETTKEYEASHYKAIINKSFMPDSMMAQKTIDSDFDEGETTMKLSSKTETLNGTQLFRNNNIFIKLFYSDVIKKLLYCLPILLIITTLVVSVWGGFGMGRTGIITDPWGLKSGTNSIAMVEVVVCFSIPILLIAFGFVPNMIVNKRNNNSFRRMRLRGFNKNQLLLFYTVYAFITLLATQLLLQYIWVPLMGSILGGNSHIEGHMADITNEYTILFIIQIILTNFSCIALGMVIGFYIKNSKTFLILFSITAVLFVFYAFQLKGGFYVDTPISVELNDGRWKIELLTNATVVPPFNLLNHGLILSIHDKHNFINKDGTFAFSSDVSSDYRYDVATQSYFWFNEIFTILLNSSIIISMIFFRNKLIKFTN